jgi:hypothetical protein
MIDVHLNRKINGKTVCKLLTRQHRLTTKTSCFQILFVNDIPNSLTADAENVHRLLENNHPHFLCVCIALQSDSVPILATVLQFLQASWVIQTNPFFGKYPKKKSGGVRSGDRDGQSFQCGPSPHHVETSNRFHFLLTKK